MLIDVEKIKEKQMIKSGVKTAGMCMDNVDQFRKRMVNPR